MTSASNTEILTAFEVNGMTPEQIAQCFDYELSVVKAILFQYSREYRKDTKKDENLEFSYTEAEEMRQVMLSLGRYSEDDNLKFKAAKWILEDKKEYRNSGSRTPALNINVIDFNQQMRKALAAEERTIKAIEIKSEVAA